MPLVTRQVNQGRLFVETTEPTSTWLDGDLWSDTTANKLKLNDTGTAVNVERSIADLVAFG